MQIEIHIAELEECPGVKQVVSALVIGRETYVLDSVELPENDWEDCLEVLEGFAAVWEEKSERDNFKLNIDETFSELVTELNVSIGE